ncbi:PREDICTED: uncharacterized protein LOC107187793 [Dufourea novaeangliae]|uniref:Coilin n=1 Tax=Dufourea novaeangliae TaxID=178035 RepID=A0A154PCQ0_DUFNO|nr:PREDICTED: uncharacterized protein LOC107187793 [Dufourea novaeangliae]KZC09675.1 Coilin [Dufourea novaeangliae]
MNVRNFRIKLDLCNYYNDARRFCWIFVDSTKMLQISHVIGHITKLVNIKKPFHLMLHTTEYLPPNEDIRILKENETILVCPGTGLQGESYLLDTRINTTTVPTLQNNFTKPVIKNNYVSDKESQTNILPIQSKSALVQENELNKTLNGSQSDVLETSALSYKPENEANCTIESNVDRNTIDKLNTDNNLTRKRKRSRKKKKAQTINETPNKNVDTETQVKKPVIINSCIIPSSKHIRFDTLDTAKANRKQITHREETNESSTNEVTVSHELDNLLSLGQNSTPVTFTSQNIKQEIKIEHIPDEQTQLDVSFEKKDESENLIKQLQEGKELLNVGLDGYPVMTKKPELKDVVAFKMLKIGSDYTPQVSEFIVGEVVCYCPKTLTYTFKVWQGLSEVQVPIGKFTITDDNNEERTLNDTVSVNYALLMEPRLLSTSNPERIPTPTDNGTQEENRITFTLH